MKETDKKIIASLVVMAQRLKVEKVLLKNAIKRADIVNIASFRFKISYTENKIIELFAVLFEDIDFMVRLKENKDKKENFISDLLKIMQAGL